MNPAHLEAVLHGENILRGSERSELCRKGLHPVKIDGARHWECGECRRERKRATYWRDPEKARAQRRASYARCR